MSEEINRDRRRFLTAAAMTLASAQLGVKGSADAQSTKPKPATVPAIKPGTNTSFGALKQIDAGVLNIGYAEAGAANGPAVILLHGWPYDIHSFVDVTPLLAKAGYRVIVPYLRGYGTTRFLSVKLCGMASNRHWPSIPSLSWMLSRSKGRFSPVLIGGRVQPTSSQRSGRSAARPWCP